MKTFQKPLTKGEEEHYIRMMTAGTGSERKRAKDILIERNLRLVAHVARKYQNIGEDMDDLISIGCIGLIKAVDTFESGKGALATYACRCIDNELLMFLRSRKKSTKEVSLYEPIGQDKEGNEIYLMDIMPQHQKDVVEQMETSGNIRKVRRLLQEVLTERERGILVLRYGLSGNRELTQTEVGELFGISRSYVSRIEKKAIQKLQEHF